MSEPLDLTAIDARLKAATPGPWRWVDESSRYNNTLPVLRAATGDVCDFGDAEQYYPTAGTEPNEADAALIAHAPTDLAALLAKLRQFCGPAGDFALIAAAAQDALDSPTSAREQLAAIVRAANAALASLSDGSPEEPQT